MQELRWLYWLSLPIDGCLGRGFSTVVQLIRNRLFMRRLVIWIKVDGDCAAFVQQRESLAGRPGWTMCCSPAGGLDAAALQRFA